MFIGGGLGNAKGGQNQQALLRLKRYSGFGLFSELTWRKISQLAENTTKILWVFESDLISNTLYIVLCATE
jgi:hypothetical protein